ncbi:MAG: SBBP repeat-containing protein [Bacteroidales bacterium]|nr:SBBP repeat-containing protein [Bacteroidales bacterium]
MKRVLLLLIKKTCFLFTIVSCFAGTYGSANNTINQNDNTNEYLKDFLKSSISFIENKGQFTNYKGDLVPSVLFKTPIHGVDLYITTEGLTYVFLKSENKEQIHYGHGDKGEDAISDVLGESEKERKIKWCRLDMNVVGASIKRENIITEWPLKQGVLNYYLGHCPDGILNVRAYQKISIKSIYPGIDWIIYADDEKGLKYDFVVHPGADPNNIKLLYKGAESINASHNNKFLNIKTPLGELQEGEIDCYEQNSGKNINSQYIMQDSTISFQIDDYDNTKTLIIDPPLELFWATYYGGSDWDNGYSLTIDQSGNVLVTGYTTSINFPTHNPGAGAYYQGINAGMRDAFILKFNNSGQREWATYYGGSDHDYGNSITTDQSGNVFITGITKSTDLPTYDPGGGTYYQVINAGGDDAFILKFNNLGQRQWATYYGGWGSDYGRSIDTDQVGNVFITGETSSQFNFPKLNPGGGAYYQFGFGGGSDAFILKFNNSGIRQWATNYGGNSSDRPRSISIDQAGNVFITGYTTSTNFPTQDPGGGAYYQDLYSGMYDAFILKFNNSGIRQWATYYGGSFNEVGRSITTDQTGNVFITGETSSTNFPTLDSGGSTYFQSSYADSMDVFILKFNNSGIRQWATYFGGNNLDNFGPSIGSDRAMTIDNSGNIFLCFRTSSSVIPTLQPDPCSYFKGNLTGSYDIFIAEFTPGLVLDWATYYYGSSDEGCKGVVTDTNGCIFIIGVLDPYSVIDTANPGNGAYFQGVSLGGYEIGIMKFCPCCPFPISITQPSNVSVCVSDSTSFYVTATSIDSISYQWFHNGTPIIGSTDSICIINPVSQTDSGYYYCQISNICEIQFSDSARLDVIMPFIYTHQISICDGDSIFVGGQYQKTSGLYYDSLKSVNYCDSIIITNLSVKNNYTLQNNVAICNGDSIFVGGQYQNLSGTYYDSLMSINNCDSIIVTILTVNNTISIQIDTVICNGDSILVGGQYQTLPGIYVDSLISVYYCDSTVYTNLSLYSIPFIDLGNDTIINIGDSITLNAVPNYVSYLWSDGSTGQNLLVSTAGVFWVEGTTKCEFISIDTIIIELGYSVNGKLTYANSVNTGINNTNVYLKQLPDVTTDSAISVVTGEYMFDALANGSYFLEPEITKPWGGINSTDALAIMKHFVGLIYLQGLYLKAGDVTATAYINTADALMVQKRYIGMVSSFPAGDWLWEDNNILIYGLNVNYDFKALCFGDVNGSNIPPLTKQEPKLTLVSQNDLTIGSFQSFEMPFAVNEQLEVGAISLALDYPSEYLVVENVKLGNGETNGLLYADNNGELRISWYNLESFKLQANEPILLITFRSQDLTGVSSDKLRFIAKESSELANSDVKVIENVNIYIPKLRVINSQQEYSLSHNFPNPFESITEIEYGLKDAGNVTLKVFNVLGEEISILISDYQEAGIYKVKFDGSNLSEGVYFYKISVTGNSDDFSQSRVMVISR